MRVINTQVIDSAAKWNQWAKKMNDSLNAQEKFLVDAGCAELAKMTAAIRRYHIREEPPLPPKSGGEKIPKKSRRIAKKSVKSNKSDLTEMTPCEGPGTAQPEPTAKAQELAVGTEEMFQKMRAARVEQYLKREKVRAKREARLELERKRYFEMFVQP